ncbi:MAG: hypothetical protein ACXABY_13850 [Candidatus Thorarchaeota archaeon]
MDMIVRCSVIYNPMPTVKLRLEYQDEEGLSVNPLGIEQTFVIYPTYMSIWKHMWEKCRILMERELEKHGTILYPEEAR